MTDRATRTTTGGGGTTERRPGAKEQAYHYVKGRVLTGTFPGGELISEGDVAGALGMSRTPVREAFLRLEFEGLLRLYPQRGALVVPVSPAEVRAVLEARLVLEQFAAEKVIRRGPEVLEAVGAGLAEQLARQTADADAGRMSEFLEADRMFHTVLLEAAGNEFLGSLYTSLRDRQVRMIGESAVRDPRRLRTILDEHARIAEAVGAGDLAGSLEAIRHHIQGTVRALGLALEQSLFTDTPGGAPV